MNNDLKIPFFRIEELARTLGLQILSATNAQFQPKEASRLKIWQEQGNAANMKYMQREPEKMANPQALLENAKSIITLAFGYDRREAPKFKKGFARVARYAWGKDYHLILPDKLNAFVALIRADFGDFNYKVFSDAVPLLERSFAAKSGLGFIGKNTLLIRPKVGSFTLLAEILVDFEVDNYTPPIIRSSCGTCSSCQTACPTGAFKSEYVLDARRCISYLSIEHRGNLSIEERKMLGEWIFGCDICQEVCPFNHGALKRQEEPDLEDFSPEYGVGALLSIDEVLRIKTQSEFKIRFKDSPLLRAKREGLIRNAICVAVNTDYLEIAASLKGLALQDQSPLVRKFSYWGFRELKQLEQGKLSDFDIEFLRQGLKDADDEVRKEVLAFI